MTTDNERRRSPRIPCHEVWLQIKVGDPAASGVTREGLPSRQARVDNLSDSGICLISAEPFELGQLVFFADPHLPSQGTVVWTCQSKLDCKGGIQFTK